MSFTEWYQEAYDEKWQKDYAFLSSSVAQWIEEYESYCGANNVEPIWNG